MEETPKFKKVGLISGGEAYLPLEIVQKLAHSDEELESERNAEITRNFSRLGIASVEEGEFIQQIETVNEQEVFVFVPAPAETPQAPQEEAPAAPVKSKK